MTHKFTLLERITNILLLNASFIDNPGLMHGKMGICIFFYHLARKTKSKIYEDYAGELLDEITEEINDQTPWDFENGLAGIGWGVEYLVQNGFVEADTDKVLEQIDNKLTSVLAYSSPSSFGLLKGLMSIGVYYLMRIKNKNNLNDSISLLTIKFILVQFIDELGSRIEHQEFLDNVHNGEDSPLDLKWDFPLLLCLLADLNQLCLYNHKLHKIILFVLEHFNNRTTLPKFHFNRVLIELSLKKLEKSLIGISQEKVDSDKNVDNNAYNFSANGLISTINDWILNNISTIVLKKELSSANLSALDNIYGKSWIYHILLDMSDNTPQNMTDLWYLLNKEIPDIVKEQESIIPYKPVWPKTFGLLDGLAGVGLQLTN